MTVICFHKPNEENGYLSNWYLSQFTVDGITFSSMEQYMMYKKAEVFGDTVTANLIMRNTDVAQIKALGRKVRNYNETIWTGVRQIIVYNGLIAKFSQSHKLRNMLLATKGKVLAECAVQDKIWGIGLSMTDSSRYNIEQWRGQNLLGFTLMMVREHLLSQER